MTLALLPQPDAREGRDRLEILTALISAPSFDPLFRGDIIKIPAGHPVYRWNCLAGCERTVMGHGDLCAAHQVLWRRYRDEGGTRAGFLQAARPFGPGNGIEEHPCRICPGRPASHLTLRLCHHHQFRWYNYRDQHGDAPASVSGWPARRQPPADGRCRVRVCPETAFSPLGLCSRHDARYQRDGRPGDAVSQASGPTATSALGRPSLSSTPTSRPSAAGARRPQQYRGPTRSISGACTRCCGPRSSGACAGIPGGSTGNGNCPRSSALLTTAATAACAPSPTWPPGIPACARRPAGRAPSLPPPSPAACIPSTSRLRGPGRPGYILTEHFGRKLSDRGSRIDLDRISQRWLRDLVWDHFADVLRSPSCPRSGSTFDHTRRAGLELSAFLEACAPGGGHDPRVLTAGHMHKFAADQRQRELDGLTSLGARGVHGKPPTVTANTRQAVFHRTRRLLRGALESGEAGRLGLDRGFITAMPAADRVIQRSRPPFTDGVAWALADEANLQALARDHDPLDRGLRDAWETIIVTGRRCSEVLELRLDCLGRYGGLAMLWHDQTKVGNYDQAIRIPERTSQMLQARQRKTLDLFQERNNRPPTPGERAAMALFPTNFRNRDCAHALSYSWFHKGFKNWIDDLGIGRQVPHQARHSLATSLLRAGASLTHIRKYLGQVSEKMAEHYVHLAQSDLEDVLQQVWVTGPGSASPGELLAGEAAPLSREQAQALAIDLSRRSTPAEGGFCTFQPVVDGGACPWNLDCGNCDKFVLSGADLLYWRRKREQWRLLAEGAPDDATADYLHAYFEPTARAIDGLEKALAGLGLLDDALALDMRKPQDYFHRVWSTAFRTSDLAAAGDDGQDGEEQEESA